MRKVNLVILLVLSFLFPAQAFPMGPLTGTANFKPQLPFNPTCTIKVPPPFAALTVQAYDQKIFGYVRYCAVKLQSGQIRVAVIGQFTNGFHSGSIMACSTHVWLGADGTLVLKAHQRLSIGHGADITLSKKFLLSKSQFDSIHSWSWNFYKC